MRESRATLPLVCCDTQFYLSGLREYFCETWMTANNIVS